MIETDKLFIQQNSVEIESYLDPAIDLDKIKTHLGDKYFDFMKWLAEKNLFTVGQKYIYTKHLERFLNLKFL
jgi:hypothetical protein